MKIGELNMKCGECNLIDNCGDSYSEICICSEERFKNVDEDTFLNLSKNSKRKNKKAIINDVYKMINKNK